VDALVSGPFFFESTIFISLSREIKYSAFLLLRSDRSAGGCPCDAVALIVGFFFRSFFVLLSEYISSCQRPG